MIDNIKADFYILESGERVHPVTMWHRHKSRAELMKELYPNIKKADGRQLKFLYSFVVLLITVLVYEKAGFRKQTERVATVILDRSWEVRESATPRFLIYNVIGCPSSELILII